MRGAVFVGHRALLCTFCVVASNVVSFNVVSFNVVLL